MKLSFCPAELCVVRNGTYSKLFAYRLVCFKSRYVDALLSPFHPAIRTAHSNSLTTEGNSHFRTLVCTSVKAVLVKEMPTDAYKVKVHFPLENRSDRLLKCLFNHRQHNSTLLKAVLSRGWVTEKTARLCNRNEESSSLWRRSKAAGRRCSIQTSAGWVMPMQLPAAQCLCQRQVLLSIPLAA